MIFTFWIPEHTVEPPSVAFWRDNVSAFRVFSDEDVLELLRGIGHEFVNLYSRIRLPSCRSDLARLVLSYEYGGLYLDAHTGPGNIERLQGIIEAANKYDVVLFDKTSMHREQGDIHLINGAIGARRRSSLVQLLIKKALCNLAEHDERERLESRHVHNNVAVVTGAWMILTNFFDLDKPIRLKEEFRNCILLCTLVPDADPGFVLYRHYGYRREGQHWSERQKCEPLFELPREFGVDATDRSVDKAAGHYQPLSSS